ncbi:MAG: DUF933 domain-containing protein [Anaerolineae bacterium]|nr:DUF933 domain-containing protein [Anaerolineae bacterium]
MLSDLITVENRLQKLNDELRIKGKKAEPVVLPQMELMERLKAALEQEQPLRTLDLTDEEIKSLRGYGFMTLKPTLVVFNCGEGQHVAPALLQNSAKLMMVELMGKLEAEISQLDAEAAEMFMSEYDITERSADRVIRLSYQLMNIQSFFTVGPDEVHAWSVPVGATAPEAAGVIHSDLQKGFIRAEVFSYDDLMTVGSEAGLKAAGKFRLEGKDYVVKDGDILNIRFSPAK